MAFKEAARKASPVVLEPVMSVEVVVHNAWRCAPYVALATSTESFWEPGTGL
jgi:hypothetical protein